MIVVADTTPLISLMKIGHLDLINQLFGEVLIPKAVFEELVSNIKFREESRLIQECSYIKTVNVTDTQAVELLRRSSGLDAGESESIVLSDLENAALLKTTGRHISAKLYEQLIEKISG